MSDFEKETIEEGGQVDLEEILADLACSTRTKLGLTMEQFSDKIGIPHREYFLALLEVISSRAEKYHVELQLLENADPDTASH